MITITLHDEPGHPISDHDLAMLAEWANKQYHLADRAFKNSFSMFREGADTLLRRRAQATAYNNPPQERKLP